MRGRILEEDDKGLVLAKIRIMYVNFQVVVCRVLKWIVTKKVDHDP